MESSLRALCRSAFALLVAIAGDSAFAASLEPVELPPNEVIAAAFEKPLPPLHVALQTPDGSPTDTLCGLRPADLNVTRGDHTRDFKVLVDAEAPRETKVFLRISRVTVDADGSSRAYHPDDPPGFSPLLFQRCQPHCCFQNHYHSLPRRRPVHARAKAD